MAEPGYRQLLSYKLAQIAFDIGWDFVPRYYSKPEDNRQRDQIKQALRSYKQNIVEGSSERSLSSKLKLYDVAKSSSVEALEDFEDILRREHLPRWPKSDPRLANLRRIYEGYPTSNPPNPSNPPIPHASPSRPSSTILLIYYSAAVTYSIAKSTPLKQNTAWKAATTKTFSRNG